MHHVVPEIDAEQGWAGQAEFGGGSPARWQRGCAWEFEIVGCCCGGIGIAGERIKGRASLVCRAGAGLFLFRAGSEYDEVLIIERLWVVGL